MAGRSPDQIAGGFAKIGGLFDKACNGAAKTQDMTEQLCRDERAFGAGGAQGFAAVGGEQEGCIACIPAALRKLGAQNVSEKVGQGGINASGWQDMGRVRADTFDQVCFGEPATGHEERIDQWLFGPIKGGFKTARVGQRCAFDVPAGR